MVHTINKRASFFLPTNLDVIKVSRSSYFFSISTASLSSSRI
jgi:hypothetical protein